MSALPSVHSHEQWRQLRADRARWLAPLARIARLHELPSPTLGDLQPAGDIVAFAGGCVIKLTAPLFESEQRVEREVLVRVHGHLGVATPSLLACGDLDGWPYMVLERLGGITAQQAWPSLPERDREAVLHQVGAALRRLHQVATSGLTALPADWPRFIAHRRAAAPEYHASTGAPPDWISQLPAYLEETAGLIDGESAGVLLHADLTDGNVLVDVTDGSPRLAGIIDFGDARLGAPGFDMAVTAIFLARGSARSLGALLDGYGIPAQDRGAWPARLLTYLLLHPYGSLTRFMDPKDAPPSLPAVAQHLFPVR